MLSGYFLVVKIVYSTKLFCSDIRFCLESVSFLYSNLWCIISVYSIDVLFVDGSIFVCNHFPKYISQVQLGLILFKTL